MTTPIARAALREVFRYEKQGRVRVYFLRSTDSGGEFWVAAGKSIKIADARRRATLTSTDDVDAYCEDVEQTLRLSGWRRLPSPATT